jgi:hypothetical protein
MASLAASTMSVASPLLHSWPLRGVMQCGDEEGLPPFMSRTSRGEYLAITLCRFLEEKGIPLSGGIILKPEPWSRFSSTRKLDMKTELRLADEDDRGEDRGIW